MIFITTISEKIPGAKFLFTDTDSLMYHIEIEDVDRDFWEDRELFDNSDYPNTSKYFSKEFVGLKSKMYSYKTATKEKRNCKRS